MAIKGKRIAKRKTKKKDLNWSKKDLEKKLKRKKKLGLKSLQLRNVLKILEKIISLSQLTKKKERKK